MNVIEKRGPTGDPDINTPEGRLQFREMLGHIVIPEMATALYTQPCIGLSNYVGKEGNKDNGIPPDLTPTLMGYTRLAVEVSAYSEENRLLAVAREGIRDRLPQGFRNVASAILDAAKDENGYRLTPESAERMPNHLRENGVVVMAPGTTTEMDGLLRGRAQPGGIRVAYIYDTHVIALAMVTQGEGTSRNVTELRMKEIHKPVLTFTGVPGEKKEIYDSAYKAITKYVLATIASMVPPSQMRGEYTDPESEQIFAVMDLQSLAGKGLIASGGFLEEY